MKNPKDSYWDTRAVRTPKSMKARITALMKAAGCKTFSDYVRHLLRIQPTPTL